MPGRRGDERPLLGPGANVPAVRQSGDDTAHSKKSLRRVFHNRQRPSTPPSRPPDRSRRKIDTRQITPELRRSGEPKAMTLTVKPRSAAQYSPPRRLKENVKDSKKRFPAVPNSNKKPFLVDPLADFESRRVEEGTASLTTEETSSDAGFNGVEMQGSFGGSSIDEFFASEEKKMKDAENVPNGATIYKAESKTEFSATSTAPTSIVSSSSNSGPVGSSNQLRSRKTSVGNEDQSMSSSVMQTAYTLSLDDDAMRRNSVGGGSIRGHDKQSEKRQRTVEVKYTSEGEVLDDDDTISRISRPSTDAGDTPPSILRNRSSDRSHASHYSTSQSPANSPQKFSRNRSDYSEASHSMQTSLTSPSTFQKKRSDRDKSSVSLTPPRSSPSKEATKSPQPLVVTMTESPAAESRAAESPVAKVRTKAKKCPGLSSRLQKEATKPMSRTKALLSRPFGRTSLPPEIARRWVVEVSAAEWDVHEHRWRYRLILQSRQTVPGEDPIRSPAKTPSKQSFTTAFTWRTLADFLWLEEALKEEFNGGLLVPHLNAVLGEDFGTSESSGDTPVESESLRNWLGDVLNGLRGEGELILNHDTDAILKSECMEAFMYRNAGPLGSEDASTTQASTEVPESVSEAQEESFVEKLLSPAFFLAPLELCIGVRPLETENSSRRRAGLKRRIDALACQSSALASAPSLDVQDSMVDISARLSMIGSKRLGRHYEVISAEKDLVLNYRETASSVETRLMELIDAEEKLGRAWLRFVSTLGSLFDFEKDAETSRMGDIKLKRENLPYRKVTPSVVDERLRSFSSSRMDRSMPALKALRESLSAYMRDLDAVETSYQMYTKSAMQLLETSSRQRQPERNRSFMRSFSSSVSEASEEGRLEQKLQSEIERHRFLTNETLMYDSLSTFCRGVTIRTSRMAWRYLSSEASQCAGLHSSAVALRTNVDVAKEKTVAKLVSRHMQEERKDTETESKLIERILNLLSSVEKRTSTQGGDDDDSKVSKTSPLHSKILHMSRDRVGRWDVALATTILEAFGVENTSLKLEESTRELRSVRKYAVGLREHMSACAEALQLLREIVLGGRRHGEGPGRMEATRFGFLLELAQLFGGDFVDMDREYAEDKKSILAQHGIHTKDQFGWKNIDESSIGDQPRKRRTFAQACVGDLVKEYFTSREAKIGWLIDRVTEMLNEYFRRIEVVEGFVYMECVGIQLERYFSEERTKWLNAFEKKTDISTAINAATKKKLFPIVKELEKKLQMFGPEVSQMRVKEAKEAHLLTKDLKAALHELATRRLARVRETSTEKVISIISVVAREEETSTALELKAIGEAMSALERDVGNEDFDTVVYRLSEKGP